MPGAEEDRFLTRPDEPRCGGCGAHPGGKHAVTCPDWRAGAPIYHPRDPEAEEIAQEARERWAQAEAEQTEGVRGLPEGFSDLEAYADRDARGSTAGGPVPFVVVPGGGIDRITAERARQVAAEGWTPEHDATHDRGQLAAAAACYAAEAWMPLTESHRKPPVDWPWEPQWWKPTGDPIRDLAKAGALIAAEIDRLLAQDQKGAPDA